MTVSEIKVLLADCPDDAVCYLYNGLTDLEIAKVVISSELVPSVEGVENESDVDNQAKSSQRINNKIIFK